MDFANEILLCDKFLGLRGYYKCQTYLYAAPINLRKEGGEEKYG